MKRIPGQQSLTGSVEVHPDLPNLNNSTIKLGGKEEKIVESFQNQLCPLARQFGTICPNQLYSVLENNCVSLAPSTFALVQKSTFAP